MVKTCLNKPQRWYRALIDTRLTEFGVKKCERLLVWNEYSNSSESNALISNL